MVNANRAIFRGAYQPSVVQGVIGIEEFPISPSWYCALFYPIMTRGGTKVHAKSDLNEQEMKMTVQEDIICTPPFLTVKEAAERVRYDPRSVWRWIEKKRLRPCRFGRKTLISEKELERFIRNGLVEP